MESICPNYVCPLLRFDNILNHSHDYSYDHLDDSDPLSILHRVFRLVWVVTFFGWDRRHLTIDGGGHFPASEALI